MSGVWLGTNWVAQHEDGHTVPVVIDEGNMSMTYIADAPGRWKVTTRPRTLREKVENAVGLSVGPLDSTDRRLIAEDVLTVIIADLAALPYVTVPDHIDPRLGRSQKAYTAATLFDRLRGDS